MIVTLKCPKCSNPLNIDPRTAAVRPIKCPRCQHIVKLTQGKNKPKADDNRWIDWEAVKESISNFVVQIGLVAFISRLREMVGGTTIVIGFFCLLGLAFFLIGQFAPESNLNPYGPGEQSGVKTDQDTEWLKTDPLSYHQAKLKETDAGAKVKSVRALGKMGHGAEPALGDLLLAADDGRTDVLAAVDQSLKAIGAPSKSNWKWIDQGLNHKARPPRAWALTVLARPEHAVLGDMPGVIDSLKGPDQELGQLAAKALDNFQVKDRNAVISRLFREEALPVKLYVSQRLAEPGKATLADLPGLVRYLADSNERVHKQTIAAFDGFPDSQRKGVLVGLAKQKEPAAKLYVASFLAKPEAIVVPETVPSLLEWLSAPSPELKEQSLLALANFGPQHADKMRDHPKVLGLALRQTSKPARTWSLRLLATPENAVLTELPGVLEALKDADAELNELAAKALDNFQTKDRQRVLARLFDEKGVQAKLYVTQSLLDSGKPTLAEVPGLVKFLNDSDQEVRKRSAQVLDVFPAGDRKSMLVAVAKNKEPAARLYVAKHLARKDSPAVPETIPNLLDWLAGPDTELRHQSALALAQAGPPHADKVRLPVVRFLAKDADAKVADVLCERIKDLGPPPRAELEEFKSLTTNSRPLLRFFAFEMMASMDLEKSEILKTFPPLLKEPEPRLRIAALTQIAKLGKDVAPLMPDLKPLLDDGEPLVRRKTYESFVALAPQEGLTTIFLKAAEDKERDVVRLGGQGLSKMPPLGKEKLPTLLGFLQHDEASLRIAAARNLAHLGKDGTPAVPQLIKALGDDDPAVRVHVTRALTAHGRDLPGLAGYVLRTAGGEPRVIWNDGQPEGPPSMVRFGKQHFVAFRSGAAATIVVLRSADDMVTWEKATEINVSEESRDPQLVVVGAQLHLYWRHKDSQVSTTADGLKWSAAKAIEVKYPQADDTKPAPATRMQALFRVTRGPDGGYYSLGRVETAPAGVSPAGANVILFRSGDGLHFEALHGPGEGIDKMLGKANVDALEADLAFLETGALVAAVRTSKSGILAFGDPPFRDWHGFDSGVKDFAGPRLWKSRQGLLVACSNLAKESKTTVYAVTPTALVQPLIVAGRCGSFFASGPADSEPRLVVRRSSTDGAASLGLVRLKVQADKIALD